MPNSVENFLMTAFSLKMLVVYALVAVIIAVPTWLLVKFSRNFPPAITHPSLKSGVGGELIVFLAGQVGWFMRGVWETFYLAGELYFVVEKAPSALTDAMVAVLPSFFALVFGAVILGRLRSNVSPRPSPSRSFCSGSWGRALRCCRAGTLRPHSPRFRLWRFSAGRSAGRFILP